MDSVRLVAVDFDAEDPAAVGAFWAGLLGREAVDEGDGILLRGDDTQVGLRFTAPSASAQGTVASDQRLHLHVTSTSREDQERIVESALRLGGRRRGTRPLPLGRDIYLTDPAGYDFCVIEPGEEYLVGCGLLGEVTCDGSREVGLFWRDALGWPVVWDRDEQIAIQSPSGGTKIGWDRWSDVPEHTRGTQRFELAAVRPRLALERLIELGATLLHERDDVLVLSDPDGSRLTVRPEERA